MGGSQSKPNHHDREGVPVGEILEPYHFSDRVLRLAEKQVAVSNQETDLYTELCKRRRSEGCTFDGKGARNEGAVCRESPETRRLYEDYNRVVRRKEEMEVTIHRLVMKEKASEIAELKKQEKEASVGNEAK